MNTVPICWLYIRSMMRLSPPWASVKVRHWSTCTRTKRKAQLETTFRGDQSRGYFVEILGYHMISCHNVRLMEEFLHQLEYGLSPYNTIIYNVSWLPNGCQLVQNFFHPLYLIHIPFIGAFPLETNQQSLWPGKVVAGDTALSINGTGPRHRFPHAQALDLQGCAARGG